MYYNLYIFRENRLDLHDSNVHLAGWGIRFQFGPIAEPTPSEATPEEGTFEKPSTYSSCMTTVESPENSRFKYCDTKWARTYLIAEKLFK